MEAQDNRTGENTTARERRKHRLTPRKLWTEGRGGKAQTRPPLEERGQLWETLGRLVATRAPEGTNGPYQREIGGRWLLRYRKVISGDERKEVEHTGSLRRLVVTQTPGNTTGCWQWAITDDDQCDNS